MRNPTDRTEATRAFHLGRWLVTPASGEIADGPERLRLEPKVMDVLEHLARRPAEVVSKAELLDAVWSDCFVTEDVLWRSISELRRALGDDSRSPRFIETLPRRGYRLVATPRPSTPRDQLPGDSPRRRAATAASGSRRSGAEATARVRLWVPAVAVLASCATLAVIAGWPERGSGAGDPATRQESVESETPQVSELYGRALDYYWSEDRSDIERAIGLYRRALTLEPAHVPSLAGLANAYSILETHHEAGEEWIDAAVATARLAVEADPDSAEAHRALGLAHAAAGRLAEAIAATSRAVELRPGYSAAIGLLAGFHRRVGDLESSAYWLGRLRSEPRERRIHLVGRGRTLATLGDLKGARKAYERALTAEPFQPFATMLLVRVDILEGRFEEARNRLEEVLVVHPDSVGCLLAAGDVEHLAGDPRAARSLLERALELSDGTTHAEIVVRHAVALAAEGDLERARDNVRRLLPDLQPPSDELWEAAYLRAAAAAVMGERRQAIAWLERAVSAGFRDGAWLALDPAFSSLAGGAGFAALQRDIATRISTARRAILRDSTHLAFLPRGEDPHRGESVG